MDDIKEYIKDRIKTLINAKKSQKWTGNALMSINSRLAELESIAIKFGFINDSDFLDWYKANR